MRSKLALAIAALCVASAAQADWKKDYDRGVKAAESGNWAEAESAMRAALAEDSKPDGRKRFQGMVHKVYVPHHYAGLAAYRQGDCEGAMEYWSNAANASVVAGVAALNAAQNKGMADCRAKLAGSTTAPAATVPTPPPPTVATTTPPATTPAKPPAPVATTTPAKPPVATPVKPAETVAKPTPAPAPPSAAPAPAALVQHVQDFLEGRYAAVAQRDPNTLGDARARAQGFLLRAASRHTLSELGDAKQLDLARADVRAARAANPSLAPDETLFSPKFRAFWSATR